MIGVVDIGEVFARAKSVEPKKRLFEEFKRRQQKEIEKAEATVVRCKEAWEKAAPDQKADKQLAGEKAVRHLQAIQEEARLELESHKRKLEREVEVELEPLIKQLAEDKGLSLIMSVPNPFVVYASDSVDLSADLIGLYDSKS